MGPLPTAAPASPRPPSWASSMSSAARWRSAALEEAASCAFQPAPCTAAPHIAACTSGGYTWTANIAACAVRGDGSTPHRSLRSVNLVFGRREHLHTRIRRVCPHYFITHTPHVHLLIGFRISDTSMLGRIGCQVHTCDERGRQGHTHATIPHLCNSSTPVLWEAPWRDRPGWLRDPSAAAPAAVRYRPSAAPCGTLTAGAPGTASRRSHTEAEEPAGVGAVVYRCPRRTCTQRGWVGVTGV